MSIALVLSASSAGNPAQSSEDGYTLQVGADSPVTMVVSTDPPDGVVTDVRLLRDGQEVTDPAPTGRTWELTGDQRLGTFKASAKEGTTLIESAETTVVAAQPAEVPATPPADSEGVVEVQVGEYDSRFTAWAGVIFTALAVALLGIVGVLLLGQIEWSDETAEPAPAMTSAASSAAPTSVESSSGPSAAAEPEPATPTPAATTTAATTEPVADLTNGTFSERSRLAISALLVAVGGVLLLAGALMAALEVRGRQRAAQGAGVTLRGTADVLDKVPEVLRRAGQLRGTTTVLVVGGLMLLLAVFTLVGAKALYVGPPSDEPSPSQQATEPAAPAPGSAEPSTSPATASSTDPAPTPSPAP